VLLHIIAVIYKCPDSTALCRSPRFEVQRYALKIYPAQRNDSDRYSCRAENQYGEVWLNFTLKVTGMSTVRFIQIFPILLCANYYYVK